jgi:hypothetical protein
VKMSEALHYGRLHSNSLGLSNFDCSLTNCEIRHHDRHDQPLQPPQRYYQAGGGQLELVENLKNWMAELPISEQMTLKRGSSNIYANYVRSIRICVE